MPRDGESTRERILNVSHALILANGFAATSIDMILEQAGITKGAFFYHFKSKADLARALVERYAEMDHHLLTDIVVRAEKLSSDPLQQVLIMVGLSQELFEGLTEPHPGCLFASYCYQKELFSEEVRGICSTSMLDWRRVLVDKLRAAQSRRPPRMTVDLDSLADMFMTVFEGAFVMSKTLGDPSTLVKQLRHYRNYVELLFS
jgi:TetR/AcrR family transcriptional repressor of nem operon